MNRRELEGSSMAKDTSVSEVKFKVEIFVLLQSVRGFFL